MQFAYRSKIFDIEGVSNNDYLYQRIVRTGVFYEIDLLEYIYRLKPFLRVKNRKHVALDVGANIGNHAIFFGSFLAEHLIAIEPNPDVIPVLRRNLSKNVDDYTLYECAVGEKAGRGTLVAPEDNIGAARVDLQNEEGNTEITTLDIVFSSWRQTQNDPIYLSLIKIDVEGMEAQVLKGAENTILEYRPHIFVEAATKEGFDGVCSYLCSLGYRKLPGRWAATPVYHFAYKPGLGLLASCHYMNSRKMAVKKMNRLKRRFTGR